MTELLEIVLSYTYNTKPCINRWNYVTNSIPAAVSYSFGLVSAFGGIVDSPSTDFPADTLMKALQNALYTGVIFQNIQARNIYSVTDFYDTPIPSGVTGEDASGQGMNGFETYGFVSSRVRTDIRRGTKRFSGATEAQVGEFGVITPSMLTVLEGIATLMTGEMVYDDETNVLSYLPCIVSKESYVTPSGRTAYKYYEDKEEQLEHIATSISWTPYDNTRSQTSRKV
jgi:hypothetical protein